MLTEPTMMFGVPTVYARMLQHVRDPRPLGSGSGSGLVSQQDMINLRGDIADALPAMRAHRMHSCGSAALPAPVMQVRLSLSPSLSPSLSLSLSCVCVCVYVYGCLSLLTHLYFFSPPARRGVGCAARHYSNASG